MHTHTNTFNEGQCLVGWHALGTNSNKWAGIKGVCWMLLWKRSDTSYTLQHNDTCPMDHKKFSTYSFLLQSQFRHKMNCLKQHLPTVFTWGHRFKVMQCSVLMLIESDGPHGICLPNIKALQRINHITGKVKFDDRQTDLKQYTPSIWSKCIKNIMQIFYSTTFLSKLSCKLILSSMRDELITCTDLDNWML